MPVKEKELLQELNRKALSCLEGAFREFKEVIVGCYSDEEIEFVNKLELPEQLDIFKIRED